MEQKQRPFDPAQVRMEAHRLTEDVFAVMADDVEETDHTATNAGFVIGEGGVLVVESLSNGRLASHLIGEVRRHTALPIQYLVNTSYHGDHCFGNFVFPRETAIIEHEATKQILDTSFDQDRKFMLDLLGEGVGVEEVVPRSAELSVTEGAFLDLGSRGARIDHIGYAQTDGDLIVRLAEENVVFVGNMLQAPPPAFPWLFEGRPREALDTYHRLYEMLDDEAVIVPGHGRTMHRSDILFSIEYLEELQRGVEDAVRRGLTLEQTQKEVRMEGYSDYSMYEFIHPRVNVPTVYGELS